MGAVPQMAEENAFGVENLRAGCMAVVYEKLEDWEADLLVKAGYLLNSAFTSWEDENKERKGRFFVNF